MSIILPEMSVFDKKLQFFTKNDNFLLTYAYFLKNESTKRRGGVPSAKILGEKNDLYKKNPRKSVFD